MRCRLLVLAALALLAAAGPSFGRASAAGPVLAIDADASGNTPRSIGTVDSCVSVGTGRSLDIDIVLPSPGIPAGRGLSGFEFTLFFDPTVLTLTASNPEMLLGQAGGSKVIAISEPLPNTFGEHVSVAVDFGPQGIEPAGSSEIGPGVLSRITLSAHSTGVARLVLRGVALVDDQSQRIPVDSGQEASVAVAAACPAASPSGLTGATPSPAAQPAVTPGATPAASVDEAAASPAAVTAGAGGAAFPGAGGPPLREDTFWKWMLAWGAALAVSGLLLLAHLRPAPPSEPE